jgi:hypothetical protein
VPGHDLRDLEFATAFRVPVLQVVRPPDAALLKQNTITLPVQINGKLRDRVSVPADATQEQAMQAALTHQKIHEFISWRAIERGRIRALATAISSKRCARSCRESLSKPATTHWISRADQPCRRGRTSQAMVATRYAAIPSHTAVVL